MEKSSGIKSITYEEAKVISPSFLFIVHNSTEYDLMIDSMTSPPNYSEVLRVVIESQPYYIGNFGAQTIVLAKTSDMGSTKPFASTTTTTNAITQWQPLYVLMIGVAASMESQDKAKIGDVIVARESIDYQSGKSKEEKWIPRSYHYYSGKIYKLFDDVREEEFNSDIDDDFNKNKIKTGAVLSGGILLDSADVKEELLSIYPEVVGLEMEFMGVASACIDAGINQIVMVKGICDFAENKSANKSQNQKKAMQNAIKLCKIVFNNPLNFNDNELKYSYSKIISKSVLISGSHNSKISARDITQSKIFKNFIDCDNAVTFAKELSISLQENGYRIVTGYGLEIGQGVIAGVLSNISMYETSYVTLQEKLVSMPFPRLRDNNYNGLNYERFKSKYREIICLEANYAISIFGVKIENESNRIIEADGVEEEIMLAYNMGKFIIPVGATEFTSRKIWEEVKSNLDKYYPINLEDESVLSEKRKLRDECFNSLGKTIDFNDQLQRRSLIESIILFMEMPWNNL